MGNLAMEKREKKKARLPGEDPHRHRERNQIHNRALLGSSGMSVSFGVGGGRVDVGLPNKELQCMYQCIMPGLYHQNTFGPHSFEPVSTFSLVRAKQQCENVSK